MRRGVPVKLWGPRFNTGIHRMKQFAHNLYLPCCQCTETCSHVSFGNNNFYMPVPDVGGQVENHSSPESTRYCSQCVIPLSWCQCVIDGWVMADWLRRWLQQCAARGACKIMGWSVQHWHSPHNSLIIGTHPAASARRDMVSYFLHIHTNYIFQEFIPCYSACSNA